MYKMSIAVLALVVAIGGYAPLSFACRPDPRCPDCNDGGPKYTPSVRPSKGITVGHGPRDPRHREVKRGTVERRWESDKRNKPARPAEYNKDKKSKKDK